MEKEIRRLIFGQGLMLPVIDYEKVFTIRKYRKEAHNFQKGEIISGDFHDGLDILLQITRDTRIDSFLVLNDAYLKAQDLQQLGYYFDNDYFSKLEKYYPDLKWTDTGAVIFFEILKVNGIPVICKNNKLQI